MSEKTLQKLAKEFDKAKAKLQAQALIVEGLRQKIQEEIGTSTPSDKPKTKPAKTGGKRAARGSVGKAITEAIESGKEFKSADIEEILTSAGESASKGSINAGLGKLVKEKKIKRVKQGLYVKA